jgi:hypothetical protein
VRATLRGLLARLHLLRLVRRLLGHSPDHGHVLLISLLRHASSYPTGSYLVEVGSTREKLEGQGSTVVLASVAARANLRFLTIDMDPENTEQARRDLSRLPDAQAVNARGEVFLRQFDQPIAAAYLDAFDINHGHHSERRVERYRQLLGTEITNEASAQMHLACAEALISRLVPGGIVVIDDTWTSDGRLVGKGALAVPRLLGAGFRVAARRPHAIALRRVG